jgi:DNA-binding response OmpR family regulator
MAGARILVVDDDAHILDAVSYFLREAGYDVRAYGDPQQAFAAAIVDSPALAVLDVMMPGMNGFDLFMLFRQQEETKSLPVIFLSALTERIGKLIAKHQGAVAYIEKPFKKEQLLEIVRGVLDLKTP